MRLEHRSIRQQAPAFLFRAVAGIHLAVLLLVGLSMVVGVSDARAAGGDAKTPVCFYRDECLRQETKKGDNCDDGCDVPGVSCHCFEPGRGCKNGGGACYVKWPAVKLTVSIGGSPTALDLADYIAKVYKWAVAAATIVAAVFLLIGGFRWLTAGDNSEAISVAKKYILDALIGLILVLGSWVILNTINPDIIALRLPKVPLVKKKVLVVCTSTEQCVACGKPYVVMKPKGAGANFIPEGCASVAYREEDGELSEEQKKQCVQKWSTVLAEKYDLSAECIGKSCKLAGCTSDAKFRCRVPVKDEKTEFPECKEKPKTPGAPVSEIKYACLPCKLDGEKCSKTGKNDQCCGGFCGGSQCTAGLPGDPCKTDKDCQGGICSTEWIDPLGMGANAGLPFACSSGGIGAACNEDDDCAGNYTCSTFGRNTCSPGTKFSYCDDSSECNEGLRCEKSGWFMANVCLPKGEPKISCATAGGTAWEILNCIAGETCTADEVGYNEGCPLKRCVESPADLTPGGKVASFCSNGEPGTPCGADIQCVKPAWKTGSEGQCVDNICMNGFNGELCRWDTDCESGHCYKGTARHVNIVTNFLNVAKTTILGVSDSICVSGELGSRCKDDAGCTGSKAVAGAGACKPVAGKATDNGLSCQDHLCRFK